MNLSKSLKNNAALALASRGIAPLLGLLLFTSPVRAGDGSIDTDAKTLNLNVLFAFSESDENLGGLTNLDNWKNVFNDASARLWNATNGQLKIGKVKVYRRAFSQKDAADVWILRGSSSAYSNGVKKLGVPGFHTTLFGSKHRSNRATFRGGFSLVHELSHYAFGLYDEYQGGFVPYAKKDSWTLGDLSPIQKLPFSVGPNIMNGGGGVGNSATEFDSAVDVNTGTAVGNSWWMTENFIMNRESAWETLGKFLWNGVNVFPNGPYSPADTALPPGDTEVTWEVIPDVSRLAIVIDRSGSMGGSSMTLAKLGAGFMTSLTVDRHTVTSFINGVTDTNVYPADRLAVIDFDSTVTETFPIAEVDSSGSVRAAAKNAIGKLEARGGTAIGHGVQKAVEVFSADSNGVAGAQENIILLSDGQDNSSFVTPMVVAAQNALARGAKIYSIALGGGVDAAGLLDMANTTGGKFFQAYDGFGLLDIYSRIYGELRGGGIMESLGSLLFENSSNDTVVPVDEFSEEVTFSMASPDPGFSVQLTSPAGKRFLQSSVADGVLCQKDANTVVFRVSKPTKGNWTLSVAAPKTKTGTNYRYNVMANATSPVVSVAPAVDSKTVVYPNPVLITCPVTAVSPVAGASVTAEVTGPNGALGSMVLFDDGAAIHGDKVAGDGVYNGYYSAFPKNGVYSFLVQAVNVNGQAATGEAENSLTPSVPVSIPPFKRVGYTTVTVSNVPALTSPDWMRVDALSMNKSTSAATTAGMQLRCTFNTAKGSAKFGTEPLKVRLDSQEITIAANSIRPTRVPGVYTITDPTRGLSGSLTSAIGGTSRNELLLSTTRFPVASFDFDANTAVTIETGSFSQTVNLVNQANAQRRSIVYLAASNFTSDSSLYVDGVNASISPKQNKTDTLRVVTTYQAPVNYIPATDALTLRVGQFTVLVPAGTLRVSTANKAMGSVRIDGSLVNVTVDLQRHIIGINGTGLNLGTKVLQTADVQLQLGAFDKSCTVTMRAQQSAGNTALSY